MNQQSGPKDDRQTRFVSHALVEVRKFKHLPFGINSGVLLDISLHGFKLEFTGELSAKPGDCFWLSIPLTPLGIFSPSRLICKTETRWFDKDLYRIGGVFIHLDSMQKMIVEQIIETLESKRKGVV